MPRPQTRPDHATRVLPARGGLRRCPPRQSRHQPGTTKSVQRGQGSNYRIHRSGGGSDRATPGRRTRPGRHRWRRQRLRKWKAGSGDRRSHGQSPGEAVRRSRQRQAGQLCVLQIPVRRWRFCSGQRSDKDQLNRPDCTQAARKQRQGLGHGPPRPRFESVLNDTRHH